MINSAAFREADDALSNTFATTMSNMDPVGWWRLGRTSGTTAADSTGRGHTGTYKNSPLVGIPDTVLGDSNTAIRVKASQCQYVEVPDHADFSLTKAQDGFNRTVSASSSWGTADHGGTWTAQVSRGSYYSCDDKARIDETSTGATWQQGLRFTLKDVELQVRASWNRAADGGPLRALTLVARMQNASNFYCAELRENVGGQLDLRLIKTVDGTSTALATAAGVGEYAVRDWWYVRFQIEGTSLRAKVWKRDTTQPSTWAVRATDSFLPSAGTVGIRSANSSSTARPVVSFEGFRAQSGG